MQLVELPTLSEKVARSNHDWGRLFCCVSYCTTTSESHLLMCSISICFLKHSALRVRSCFHLRMQATSELWTVHYGVWWMSYFNDNMNDNTKAIRSEQKIGIEHDGLQCEHSQTHLSQPRSSTEIQKSKEGSNTREAVFSVLFSWFITNIFMQKNCMLLIYKPFPFITLLKSLQTLFINVINTEIKEWLNTFWVLFTQTPFSSQLC